ncbi:MAG: 5'-methylthioadenosine/S-adenosylhomocysteine nucleosidase [Chloroflexi bacterium]|nr:5'-methylthioadenosine/S-adenosylhomocysteine nucleosidase [Chloroflexota bacterium]
MPDFRIVILISADVEWQAVSKCFADAKREVSPFGEWFSVELPVGGQTERVIFFHGGWGKIAAAASTQYVIDRWRPEVVINLGTCGGFAGEVEAGAILLVERTVVYDIIDQMGDPAEAIAFYASDLDLSWLREPFPMPVRRVPIVSADRDLIAAEIPRLKAEYGAIAGDWESGAIAFVAKRNGVHCLILRGVTDLVSEQSGEAYGNFGLFAERAEAMMRRLVEGLAGWVKRAQF